MLTNREVVKRINNWVSKPKANVPVCYHDKSHGRLKAVQLNGDVLLSCKECSFKLLPNSIPESAFRQVS